MVPPNSLIADKEMILKRFPKVLSVVEELNLDQNFGAKNSEIGIISSGAVFETLKQVLEESNNIDAVKLYKLASSYPLNARSLLPFLTGIKHLIVVEEKRGFLEAEIKDFVVKHGLSLSIWGKEFKTDHGFQEGFPAHGGLSYEIIYKKLALVFDHIEWENSGKKCFNELPHSLSIDFLVPKRLPTFCPGCPHRETLSVMKEIRKVLSEKKINLISHGDVGCYSLSFLEPFKEMHDLSAMGQGGSLGAGTDLFTSNPSVVLMGDSTFFHSGMTSISNSVQMGHNITYILLDNDNTAMTGHQVTPRSGQSVEGEARPRQNMLQVAKSLQVDEAIEVNPSDRYFYRNLLLEMIQRPGVKVIVSNKECGLTFHGRKKREERKIFAKGDTESVREFYQINTLACEDCRACVEMTGCPGLSQTFDAYGTKVNIDPQICVSDSYCTKIKACPSFELVKVYDYHPNKYRSQSALKNNWNISNPVFKKDLNKIASGEDFRGIVIGVGGTGVTTISRVIAEASSFMGGRNDLNFKFVDQKGLAQRNGSVTSHLSIFNKNKSQGQVVPLGTAGVVLAPDLLEGARAIEYLSPQGVLIIDSDFQVPLSILLDRAIDHEVIDEDKIRNELIQKLDKRLIMAPLKKLSFEKFQKPVYSSAMILGIAFQSGHLPFTEDDLKLAFKNAIPKAEFDLNWQAFMLGREWFENNQSNPVMVSDKGISSDMDTFEESIKLVAYPWQRPEKFKNLLQSYLKLFTEKFPEIDALYLAQYLHDIIVFDQGQSLTKFYEYALNLRKLYLDDEFKLAMRILAKTFWVKDEVFVSHLMISPLKTKRDKERYSELGTSFEVVHINRPAFILFGKKIEFDFSPKPWMLKIMRHLRILRTLMPEWHKLEKTIAFDIQARLTSQKLSLVELKKLDSVKGYREYRYQNAKVYLGKTYE